jgi:hypothetical protein
MEDDSELVSYNGIKRRWRLEDEMDVINHMRKGLPAYSSRNLDAELVLDGIQPCLKVVRPPDHYLQRHADATMSVGSDDPNDFVQNPITGRWEPKKTGVELVPVEVAELIFKLHEVEAYEKKQGLTKDDPHERRLVIEENSFVWCGQYWIISFLGERAIVRDVQSIWCLVYLLENPSKEIHVFDLTNFIQRRFATVSLHLKPAGEPQEDDSDLAMKHWAIGLEIKRELHKIGAKLEEARETGTLQKIEKLEEQRDKLLKYVRDAKRSENPEVKRARQNVSKHLRKAMSTIAKSPLKKLSTHLIKCIKSGIHCSYSPEKDIFVEWSITR